MSLVRRIVNSLPEGFIGNLIIFKNGVSKYTPDLILRFYHLLWALLANVIYQSPSRRVAVIGVTGTKGKTSTCVFLHEAISSGGHPVGLISTAEIRIGSHKETNTRHMTLPGRLFVQKKIREMVDVGCEVIIVETPSEAIHSFRHWGVKYDILVYTNISPEHLMTHKTFDNYCNTKLKIFKDLTKRKDKILKGVALPRRAYINADSDYASCFASASNAGGVKLRTFGFSSGANIRPEEYRENPTEFTLNGDQYSLSLPGKFNIKNALPAITIAQEAFGVLPSQISEALGKATLPGRMELIKNDEFHVFLDYAHEPLSISSSLQTAHGYTGSGGRVIAVVGAVGGSRYLYNGIEIGGAAQKHADVIVVTDVDPFRDDPKEIIRTVVQGIGVILPPKELHILYDRASAIKKAISLACAGDVVIVTGKGSEVTMETEAGTLPWSDKKVIQEALT